MFVGGDHSPGSSSSMQGCGKLVGRKEEWKNIQHEQTPPLAGLAEVVGVLAEDDRLALEGRRPLGRC